MVSSIMTRMSLHLLCSIVLLNTAAAESSSGVIFEAEKRVLVVTKGEYASYPNHHYRKIHNASGRILKVIDEGKQLRLLGKNFGETTLSMGEHSLRVVVTNSQQKKLALRAFEYLDHRPGLKLYVEHPCHTISGELLRWTDWVQLHDLALEAQACFRFKAKLAPEIRKEVENQLIPKFTQALWGKPSLINEDPIELEFPEVAKNQTDKLKSDLSWWGLKPQFSKNTIDVKPMIRVKILVAEINRNQSRNLGISWPGSYQAHLVPHAQIEKDWELELKALESQGQGKILASPSLLSRSGESAEFLAGGEIPYPGGNRKNRALQWKSYGISIKIVPHADARGFLKIEVSAEVSSPDGSFTHGGVPALKSHRIKSHFNMQEPRTIALSGLLREEQSNSQAGLPFLSRLPLVGSLFSSRQFLQNRTELIILVTPRLIKEPFPNDSLPPDFPDKIYGD